jgi:hypothetical protein
MSDFVFGVAANRTPKEIWPLLNCEATKEGLFIWKDRLKDFSNMRCMAVSNPPGIAYDAVYAAFYLVNGSEINKKALTGPYGRSLYVEIPVVTDANLKEWMKIIEYTSDVKRPVNQLMTPEEIKKKWFLK